MRTAADYDAFLVDLAEVVQRHFTPANVVRATDCSIRWDRTYQDTTMWLDRGHSYLADPWSTLSLNARLVIEMPYPPKPNPADAWLSWEHVGETV